MTDTTHQRAKWASLGGLFAQLAAFVGIFSLAFTTNSPATYLLTWYILGGVLIWLAALLVSHQRELVILENRDLEELRREKQAVGADTSFFEGAGGGGLGFQIAERRLSWMLRWLVPGFGLITAGYLAIFGLILLLKVHSLPWPEESSINVGLIVTALVMFVLFLFSRYAAGMGRVAEWHLLRAGGSYMLGNTIVAFLLVIFLGLQLVDPSLVIWEQRLAYFIPGLMILLGAEILINFVADIYRPRSKTAEPRACYDSRLLGVFSEPGGIAHSIAEAVNYQFGFQVSQTWFYQFMAKYLVPLLGVGALVLWLMTSLVVVNPYERVVIERFGRLVDADKPLSPGVAFKLPWPLAVAHVQATDELHQIIIGARFREIKKGDEEENIILWTDNRHAEEHFNFLVAIRPDQGGTASKPRPTESSAQTDANVAVHILQLSLAIQYRVDATHIAEHMTRLQNPDDLVRDVAWRELVEYVGTGNVDDLLGKLRGSAGRTLRTRIRARLLRYDPGIDVVYTGLQAVHPVPKVAKSFQDVIIARQQKIARIRVAEITENQFLSKAAGDRAHALALVEAIDHRDRFVTTVANNEQIVGTAPADVSQSIVKQLVALSPQFMAVIKGRLATDRANAAFEHAQSEYQLGITGTPLEVAALRKRVEETQKALADADATLSAALEPVHRQAADHLNAAQIDALIKTARAQVGLMFWNRELESQFRDLGGQAAQIIAEAQANRWDTENRASADLARLKNERRAYQAAPELFRERTYLETVMKGLAAARKYFLAFDPGQRDVNIRVEAQEVIGPDFSLTGEP